MFAPNDWIQRFVELKNIRNEMGLDFDTKFSHSLDTLQQKIEEVTENATEAKCCVIIISSHGCCVGEGEGQVALNTAWGTSWKDYVLYKYLPAHSCLISGPNFSISAEILANRVRKPLETLTAKLKTYILCVQCTSIPFAAKLRESLSLSPNLCVAGSTVRSTLSLLWKVDNPDIAWHYELAELLRIIKFAHDL